MFDYKWLDEGEMKKREDGRGRKEMPRVINRIAHKGVCISTRQMKEREMGRRWPHKHSHERERIKETEKEEKDVVNNKENKTNSIAAARGITRI